MSEVTHYPVIVIGGGQAGLAMSACLSDQNVKHVVIEKHRIGHSWRTQRWDSFCLVTPNWQCQLPGFDYAGQEPHGFMLRDEIVAYVEAFAAHIKAPVREGVAVTRLGENCAGGFTLATTEGEMTADQVVLAVSAYHRPATPRLAGQLPGGIIQLHSSAYKNPEALPPGAVLVVGSGQSGCQIAEDLHLAGRKVHLVTGSAPRCPRFYRGRDAVDWLADLGQYDLPVERHPLREEVRRKANHYLTGRGGGRDIDLRQFAREGMALYGRLIDADGASLSFADDLKQNLDAADGVYNGICGLIDTHIADAGLDAPSGQLYTPIWQPDAPATRLDLAAADVSAVVWATGFRSDWSWIDLPILDDTNYPSHRRGVTAQPGLYVLGLPWMHTWGSGRFLGVGNDARFLAREIGFRLVH